MTESAFPQVGITKEGAHFFFPDMTIEGTAISEEASVGRVMLPDFIEAEQSAFASTTPIHSITEPVALLLTEAWKSYVNVTKALLPSPEDALDVLEATRGALGLKVAVVAKIAGASTRRYQEWRRGETVPADRLRQLYSTTMFLSKLQRTDPLAASSLLENDPDATLLIARGEFGKALERFEQVRDELEEAFEPQAFVEWEVDDEASSVLAGALDDANVQRVLRSIERVLPETRAASEAWRALAVAAVKWAVERLMKENTVSEEWEFLAAFDDEELDAFRRGAIDRLRNPHVSREEWSAWLRDQEELSQAGLRPFELAKRTPLPELGPSGQPTVAALARLGVDLLPPWKGGG